MPTLVLSDWLPNGSRQLGLAAQEAGWDVVCLEGLAPLLVGKNRDLVYYGTADLAHEIAGRLGLVLLEAELDWLARLPWKYAQRGVRYATVAEARRLAGPVFVKPADATDKCFDAGVFPGGWAIPERRGFAETVPVLIAEPVTWEVEYRCFLLEGELMTAAPYARAGRWVRARDGQWIIPEVEAEQVARFCRTLAGDRGVPLPPAVTMDLGRMEDGGWAVVELNPVWSSGLYGCDPARVLPVLHRACVPEEDLTDQDRRWVIRRA
jgi:hypothetical protein